MEQGFFLSTIAACIFCFGVIWGYGAGKDKVLNDLEAYGMYKDKEYEFHVVKEEP